MYPSSAMVPNLATMLTRNTQLKLAIRNWPIPPIEILMMPTRTSRTGVIQVGGWRRDLPFG